MAPKRKVGNADVASSKRTKTKQEEPKNSGDLGPAKISFSIEHWAAELCSLLQKKNPGLSIELNASKPRKGCFEIQDQEGNKYVSLLNMPRPFKALRELDLNKVAEDIAAHMKAPSSSEPADVSEAAAESATPIEAADVAAMTEKLATIK